MRRSKTLGAKGSRKGRSGAPVRGPRAHRANIRKDVHPRSALPPAAALPSWWPFLRWPPLFIPRPAPHTEQELQALSDGLFRRLGVASCRVRVQVTDEPKVLAEANGSCSKGDAVGTIKVARALLDLLNRREVEFVVAHEVAHIWRNHGPQRQLMFLARSLANAAARRSWEFLGLVVAWDMGQLRLAREGKLAPYGALVLQHEVEADGIAVFLTEDLASAESALRKLAGGDGEVSHTWEVLGRRVPVFTVGERLDVLRQVVDAFEKLKRAKSPSA